MNISYIKPETREKLARIPGTADWISKYKNQIEKKATEEDLDPYSNTKTVAKAGAIGVPSDILFDLGVKATNHFKQNRDKIKNLKMLKEVFKSPEWKAKMYEFGQEQKGIAIPASIAIASIPALVTYRADRQRHLQRLKEERELHKSAEEDPYSATKTMAALNAAGVPVGKAVDAGTRVLSHYHENKNALPKGLKGVGAMIKSPELKAKMVDFLKEQKIGLPVSVAMAATPVALAFLNDRRNHLKNLQEKNS